MDRLTLLEQRVEELARSVDELAQIVSQLAGRPIGVPRGGEAPFGEPPAETAAALGSALPGGFALVGRSLVALGGAYLLRALTAAGLLPELGGVLLAFVYALFWLALAHRAGSRARTASANFHGATAVAIGLPLLWEATSRFHYLAPEPSAAAVAAFVAATLAVAWRHRLAGLAWTAGLAGAAACFALVVGTKAWAPYCGILILLGLAGLLLAWGRGWRGLGWLLPLAAFAAVFLMALVARVKPQGAGISQQQALALALALCLAVLGTVAFHLRSTGRQATGLEWVHSVLAFVVGYGGAASLAARLGGVAPAGVGALGVALALGFYLAAFGVIERRERRNLLLATSLGLAFVLTGTSLLLPSPALALTWSGLAVVATATAVGVRRVTLALHGTAYALAAALASGLVAAAGYALAAPATSAAPATPATPAITTWPPLTLPALVALAAAAFACALPVPRPAPYWKPYASTTRLLQLVVLAWGACGALLYAVASVLPKGDAGLLAAARTLILVCAALLLAWASRRETWREAGWLVYPILVLVSLKLIVEDFPHGRPATLFVALALVGGAFILAPRLLRRA